MTSTRPLVRVRDEVSAALRAGDPVVALETAVLTTGLPRRAIDASWTASLPGWRADAPAHHETLRLLERTVRAAGAVPAVIAVLDGVLRVGLDDDELAALAAAPEAGKAAARDLPALMALGGSAGTTVSATLVACACVEPAPIRVFATGGIGGVHRGWTRRPDVSADLPTLARTACCVVCAGAKSILDPVATLEALEALGVPVIGYGTGCWPQFFAAPDPDLCLTTRLDDPASVARLCRARWETLREGGLLLAVPVDEGLTLARDDLERATLDAEARARADGATGPGVTPHLLASLAELTGGRTLHANVELLRRNAWVAAEIAREVSRQASGHETGQAPGSQAS